MWEKRWLDSQILPQQVYGTSSSGPEHIAHFFSIYLSIISDASPSLRASSMQISLHFSRSKHLLSACSIQDLYWYTNKFPTHQLRGYDGYENTREINKLLPLTGGVSWPWVDRRHRQGDSHPQGGKAHTLDWAKGNGTQRTPLVRWCSADLHNAPAGVRSDAALSSAAGPIWRVVRNGGVCRGGVEYVVWTEVVEWSVWCGVQWWGGVYFNICFG